jgi:hypothetical protein
MSTNDAATGKVVNVTVDGEQLTLVEEDSISYSAGESTNDFALAAETITETFHEAASPTLEFTSAVDNAADPPAGWTALGIFDDASGDYQVSGSRRVSNVTVEWLDADGGAVETGLDIPSATVEYSGVDGQNPPTYDITLHINEAPTLTNVTTA